MARQRVQQRQTEEIAPFVQSDAGVSFRDGVMHVSGMPQRPVQTQHWMSSNELTQYTTVAWQDPVTGTRRSSCNCPGWRTAKPGQKRTCCHTKDLEGTATCDRQRVEASPIPLTSVRDVEQHVESVKNVRELRSIMLD